MDIRITPHALRGSVTPPPSKSLSHRALIAARLARAEGRLTGLAESKDIAATAACLDALFTISDGFPVLDCGESGSTLRFLIPLSLVLRGGAKFTGRGRLMQRPQEPYFEIFRKIGVHFEQKYQELDVMGALTPGVYELPGDVSSQFVTGLLYALPLLPGDSEIRVTSPLQSREYVTITVDVLKKYGISVENRDFTAFSVPGNQRYAPCDYAVEADWSQAAFWDIPFFFDHPNIDLRGLNFSSLQGDRVIHRWLRNMLYDRAPEAEYDMSQTPDLLPPMAAAAAIRSYGTANGSSSGRYGQVTRFVNAARLRMKESDRITATANMLRSFGVECREGPDSLAVTGTDRIRSCTVDGANDHRIVMAAAILATRADGPVTILGAEAVEKSYPTFFDEYRRLGGIADVL